MNTQAYHAMVKRTLGTHEILSKGSMLIARIDGKHNMIASLSKQAISRLHPLVGKEFCDRFLEIVATPCLMFPPTVNRTDVIIIDEAVGTWSATFMWAADKCLMMAAHGQDIIAVFKSMPKYPGR